jgi:hypothetical protein
VSNLELDENFSANFRWIKSPTTTATIDLLAILPWVPGCSTPESTAHDISSHVFGGQTAFDTFRTASDVTAERLDCKTAGICISTNLADYRRYSRRALSQAQIDQLRDLFSQRASYPDSLWRMKPREVVIKACGTRYGLRRERKGQRYFASLNIK